jgi:hypothetical protein
VNGPLILDEGSRRFLHTLGERYPYAFGYLAVQVRLFLDGSSTADGLKAVLDALEAELEGECR